MIEIILLFLLAKSIGTLAIKKGLPAGRWKFTMVIAWIIFETIGLMIGLAIFGKDNLIALMGFGLVCAFGGYLTIRYVLENKPDDKIKEDIHRIGTDELKP